jgi:hypothetical protein
MRGRVQHRDGMVEQLGRVIDADLPQIRRGALR